ncbi:DNA primase [Paenibacillus septentrionalis]|uniref:DNA primase n=1 Tax=Paenibacillus septentrionalis TaxID=429342 RepID=A0ABW1V3T4_9BACL
MAGDLIPDEVIDAVRNHHDIVEVVGKYVHLTKHGKYMKGLCPFHSEKTPSFTVTPELQIYHCYGCGKGGNVIRFVEEMEGYTFPEAIKMLAEDAGIPVTWTSNTGGHSQEQDNVRNKIIEAHELAAKFYHHILNNTVQGEEAKRYLIERGLTDKLIDQFMIGYAPVNWDVLTRFLMNRGFDPKLLEKGGLISVKNDGEGYYDRFRNRIMFLLRDRNGKPVAFAGRIIGEGQPKYLNSPETMLFTKSRMLYNMDLARSAIKKVKQIVLFEGYMDVIKAWSAEVHNGVATMGTALTEEHCLLLKRHCDEAIICYDGDSAGQAAAYKSIPMLEHVGIKVLVALLPKGMDPDEYIKTYGGDAFRHGVIEQAVSVTKFKLIYLRKNHILSREEGRNQYIVEAVKIIAELDSSTEREIQLKELSKEFDISLDALKQDCHEFRIQQQNFKQQRDNNQFSWNNGRNEKRKSERNSRSSTVLPAYVNAERRLLHVMMRNRDVALAVHDKLGDAFNIANHIAIAAYLYAYYASGYEADAARFVATLEDEELERTATELLMMDGGFPFDEDIMDAWIQDIVKVPKLQEIERKKEEAVRAERAGDPIMAARLLQEINSLERELKNYLQ